MAKVTNAFDTYSASSDREDLSNIIYNISPMQTPFMSSIGKKANISTPVCNALITIASSMHQKDYYAKGRTLEKLGIGDYSVGELKSILKEGFTPDV